MIATAAVVWKLKSVNTITAIVGTRIYPCRAPQGADLPYIIVDHPPGQTSLAAYSQGQGAIRKTPLVIYCYADKDTGGIKQADDIAQLVDAAIAPVSGFASSVQWNGTWIDHCVVNDHYAHIESPQEGEEVGWRAMIVSTDVYHLNCKA